MSDNDSTRDYFYYLKNKKWEIAQARKAGESLTPEEHTVAKIPVDPYLIRVEEVKVTNRLKCLYCGNPDLKESVSPYECKRCWLKRMTTFLGEDQTTILYDELHHKLTTFKLKKDMGDLEESIKQNEEDDEDVPGFLRDHK